MNILIQLLVAFICIAIYSFIFKRSFVGFLLLISVPMLFFYHFSFFQLLISVCLGILLKELLSKSSKTSALIMFVILLVLGLFLNGHKIYENIGMENVANSQRGEHSNYQTNLTAKMLHNKTTAISYYFWNLSDRLSPAAIFSSSNYPDISKYLPLGFLFPWYLIGFIFSLRKHYKEYLRPHFILAILSLFTLNSVLALSSANVFIFAVIWFVLFESVDQMEKMPKKYIFITLLLNLVCLSVFHFPVSVMKNT